MDRSGGGAGALPLECTFGAEVGVRVVSGLTSVCVVAGECV